MVDKLYQRSDPHLSLRPIANFVVGIQRFVIMPHPPIIEKLRSQVVAMHAYGVYAYYT